MSTDKPFAPSADRNKDAILVALNEVFPHPASVLEIGSGSGQHAVFFAAALSRLTWQPSDVAACLPGINAWRADAALSNVPEPLALDAAMPSWPVAAAAYNGAFSANTAHIMSWPNVIATFRGVSAALCAGGVFCLYGPFSDAGVHNSEGNARFDASLRAADPEQGIRAVAEVDALAAANGLADLSERAMPANNRLLVWRKALD